MSSADFVRVFIIRRSDGAEVEDAPDWREGPINQFYEWCDEDDGNDEYWWTEGNYACDCNRHLAFERRRGVAEDDIEDPDCGRHRYRIRVERLDGEVVYEQK